MLELKEIKKDYLAGDNMVHALKGVSLKFRKSEFVSILGPSGCGKTTLLNIIGGLDKYTSGDLIINGRSTKDFKDRDWDSYRNHSIGFVFQTYNLIPHQTVLGNVELALTLTGVGKKERRERAKQALIQVGLGDQLNKRPNQMSGGQMQRVAIARALVNNPDIILADEPTGALDTETSIQVMEILKEVSKSRLVIMVTHNPDLAEKYSTRIINILDGEILKDSKPLNQFEEIWEKVAAEKKRKKDAEKKPSMSFFTAFKLSLRNLFTKKGRTILTGFAGSIGIIGIALILSVSQGTTKYIDKVQEDTLSSYPLTLESTSVDLSSLMSSFMGQATSESNHDKDAVYKTQALYDLVNAVGNIESSENDLKSFKAYLEKELDKEDSELSTAVNGVQYSYSINPVVYTKNVDNEIIKSDAQELMMDIISESMNLDTSVLTSLYSSASSFSSMSSMTTMADSYYKVWTELLPAKDGSPVNDLITSQYEVAYGKWPEKYNEVVLITSKDNELDDISLYALGLLSREDVDKIVDASLNATTIEKDAEIKKWSYQEIVNSEYRVVLDSSKYTYDEALGVYSDLSKTEAGIKYLYENAIPLKVVGIIRPKEDADIAMLQGSIGYTYHLTEYLVEQNKDSKALKAQLDSKYYDIFTGLPFKDNTGNLTSAEKREDFNEYVEKMTSAEKANLYVDLMSIMPEEMLKSSVDSMFKQLSREGIEAQIKQEVTSEMALTEEDVNNYLAKLSDEDLIEMITPLAEERVKESYKAQVKASLSKVPQVKKLALLTALLNDSDDEKISTYYDEVMVFSDTSYDDNLKTLGYVDLDKPSAINIYATSFENKDVITDAIAKYNEGVDDELKEIKYTDYVGLIMSSVTTIINAITYVLIAFVAISLIVSSIMIGVITLISVQERTKEIGILRAIGASKKNVSRMFNAETIIIGFLSGAIGIGVTYLLILPINLILHKLTNIASLSAYLPPVAAIALIVISMLLTLFAGIIPSRSAAKKDPVIALRTE